MTQPGEHPNFSVSRRGRFSIAGNRRLLYHFVDLSGFITINSYYISIILIEYNQKRLVSYPKYLQCMVMYKDSQLSK